MTDKINFKEPDWTDIPSHCPHCDADLEHDLDDGGRTGWKTSYRDGESNHGEYTEVYCLSCEFPLQRHYSKSDITTTEDPFIDPTPWVFRAHELETETGLKHREAQVEALKEENRSHPEIASQLGISESTVGEYSRRISQRIEEGIWTLEELGTETDPLRHMEAHLDGLVVTPSKKWECPACNAELKPGSGVKFVGEYVGKGWQTIEIYCNECDPDVTGGVFDEAPDFTVTYAVVEGRLDTQGDDYVEVEGSWNSRDSLTLRDPSIRKIIN